LLIFLGIGGILLSGTACVSLNGLNSRDRTQAGSGLFGRIAGWLPGTQSENETGTGPSRSGAVPQQWPVGSVHLVNTEARFILIRTSRTTALSPEADLMSYDQTGRPTGKLRLSPENKAGFLAADIVQGNPQPGDRVVVHGFLGDPQNTAGETTNPATPAEVLE
jgi:hypothetical protein